MKLPMIETVPIDAVLPYDKNPRKIPAEAVTAVKESIERFGYVQPIVVTTDFVIIAGHTRFQALQALGHTTVDIFVTQMSPEQARAYRVADNRLGETTSWDDEQLVAELLDQASDYLDDLFPDIDLELATLNDATDALADRDPDPASDAPNAPHLRCPSCDHAFEVDEQWVNALADTTQRRPD